MDTSTTETESKQTYRSIDVTGLSEPAIRAVEDLVALLKGEPARGGMPPQFASRQEWRKAIRAFAAGHEPAGTNADWSRERIYSRRGECTSSWIR
jgi:hypothetical protein